MPRLWIMAALVPGGVAFGLADRFLMQNAPLWQRVTGRTVPIITLVAMMLIWPASFGIMFTLLPVMILFYLVFGSMARAITLRAGPTSAGIGLGLCLAWSLAASLPLFIG